ncbi:UDP-glycosyltransferase 86A1-like [Solanum dulcamara]|uniref:UDP-glycosyltransferase 86A1-like n=1 Tax=Solanum dulcamara TaxID=45834 RepID=UPI002485B99F|nr:UDP-glycosyltransferase 86A1-like [Solanum dulcamara]
MAKTIEKKLPLHALVIPCPFQGHINPTIHLSLKLASKGFIITFINTQFIHSQITKAQLPEPGLRNIFSKARESGLDIRYLTISDGFPLEFDRNMNSLPFLEGLINRFSSHVDELVAELVKDDCVDPINCLVADTFFVWPSIIAKKYEIFHVSFFTEPALVFALYYHMDLLEENGHFGSHENRKDIVDYIPGVKSIASSDLPSLFQNSVVHQLIYKAFQDVRKADIIIANTVQELEPETIASIQEKHNFYAIGPIVSANFTELTISSSLWSEYDCTQWLDTKPHGSVLYVSFGSVALVNKEDIIELAHGLMLSEVNFIWVLRYTVLGQDENDILPVGYEEKVKDRGLIVPWCNQMRVISHSAIGGFLSHCGWNSVVESIWCGVPLICSPLVTDQLANRKLVVYNWKVGINLRDGESITREEVRDKIKYLVNKETSSNLRKNVAQVKETFHNTLAMNGSSNVNFNKLVEELKMKISLA